MSGPWEQFQSQQAAAGPWTRFQSSDGRQQTENATADSNRNKGFIQNLAEGIPRAAESRVLGALQTARDLGETLYGPSPQDASEKAAYSDLAHELNVRGKGTGVGGFVGEVVGDPITAATLPVAPASGFARLALQGAGQGAVAGLTAPQEKGGFADRLINTAIGAGAGAVTGGTIAGGAKLATGAKNIAVGTVDRILAATGSDKAADRVAYRILATRLLQEGKTPEQVAQAILEMRSTGLGGTLGEATGSTGVLAAEANIKRGTGEAANTMRETLATRGNETIPNAVTQRADQLIGEPGRTGPLYKAASDEAAQLQDDVMGAVTGDASKAEAMTLGDAARASAPSQAINDASTAIENRLSELGDVSTVERKALTEAQRIIQNAQRRGGTFDALLDAKKQLDDLYIDGADAATQKQANRHVVRFIKQLDDALTKIAPEAYPTAKTAAKEVMAGRQLQNVLADTAEGGIGSFFNKVWSIPAQREDFLAKLPDDATRANYTQFFTQLEKIVRGHGGRNPAMPAGGHLLEGDILGAQPWRIDPGKWLSTAARTVGDVFAPQVRTSMAKATTNTSEDALTTAMKRAGANVLSSPTLQRASAVTAQQAGKSATKSSPRKENIQPPSPKPQSNATPLLQRIALAESGGNTDAKNPNSTASGLYQFTNDTWAQGVSKFGKQLGVTLKDKSNPEAQTKMAQALTDDNARILTKKLGREPSDGEIYAAHFLGASDALKLIVAQGTGKQAIMLYPRRIVNDNRSIFFDGKTPRSVEQVLELLTNKVSV